MTALLQPQSSITHGAATRDYLSYQVDFGSGVSNVSLRVSSGSTGGTVEIRLGSPTGTLIGSIPVTNTCAWGTWTTRSASVTGATGVQDLYLVFQGEPASRYLLGWHAELELVHVQLSDSF